MGLNNSDLLMAHPRSKTPSATLDFSPSIFRHLCEGEQMYEYVSCGADAPLRGIFIHRYLPLHIDALSFSKENQLQISQRYFKNFA